MENYLPGERVAAERLAYEVLANQRLQNIAQFNKLMKMAKQKLALGNVSEYNRLVKKAKRIQF